MKILYCVSLFSGLSASVQKRKWEPAGAPTIYRMIEALDAGAEQLDLVFCPRNRESSEGIRVPTNIVISGLKSPVWLLPYYQNSLLAC